MDDKEFFYDISKFETQIIAQRNSFLLVFQSMLFTATALISGKQVFFPAWILIAIGFLLSLIWLYLNWLTHVVEKRAIEKLQKIDERVEFLFAARKANWLLKVGSVSVIVTFVVPSLMAIGWALLFVFYVS